jgi:hypothetical protein
MKPIAPFTSDMKQYLLAQWNSLPEQYPHQTLKVISRDVAQKMNEQWPVDISNNLLAEACGDRSAAEVVAIAQRANVRQRALLTATLV